MLKRFKLLVAAIALFVYCGNAQKVIQENNYLKFTSVTAYEECADDLSNRVYIDNASADLQTVKKSGAYADEETYPDFLQKILNTDKSCRIGNFFIRFDLENGKAFVMDANSTNAYSVLQTASETTQDAITFTTDEDYAIDVLEAIEAGTLTMQDYKDGMAQGRITWPWNKCGGAPRNTQKSNPVDIWNRMFEKVTPCNDNYNYYGLDNKVVYQKFIFYFSLQSKVHSKKDCVYSNWIGFNYFDADLKLDGTVTYRKVSDCKRVITDRTAQTATGNTLNWRPYEGSRALTSYDFNVDFRARHTGSGTAYTSFHYHIGA